MSIEAKEKPSFENGDLRIAFLQVKLDSNPKDMSIDTGSDTAPRLKVRIESLSDLVFGLALSIGSLTLIGRSLPSTGSDLAYDVFQFGFSFVILVMIWLGYSRTISVLPVESTSALFLNLVLLFCVALEPYLFFVLFSGSDTAQYYASIAYGLDVGVMFLALATLARLLLKEEKNLTKEKRRVHPLALSKFKRLMIIQYIIALIFLASALPLPFLWIPTAIGAPRFVLWYSSFAIFFALRITPGRKKKVNV